MGSYEWMELQTLTDEIAASRSRLAAARATRDLGRVKALEEEITAAEGRRDRLLKHITTNLVTTPEKPPPTEKPRASPHHAEGEDEKPGEQPIEGAAAAAPATLDHAPAAGDGPSFPQSADATVATTGVASPTPAAQAAKVEGGNMAWNQLTPGDIERAKHELGVRRADMLARHAEELKALEGDQAQIETLEQAIAAFAEKFARTGAKAETERERRQGD